MITNNYVKKDLAKYGITEPIFSKDYHFDDFTFDFDDYMDVLCIVGEVIAKYEDDIFLVGTQIPSMIPVNIISAFKKNGNTLDVTVYTKKILVSNSICNKIFNKINSAIKTKISGDKK